ncbi:hippurate hydrolase [Salinihabitans flavidus]|uniref:Hippurate hydrolase n=1 Tax=Salinihabitans flavidus TaxID=569882 RepID=A0A1H8RQP0_9RHOB|nr:M20 aminoacylase family protein [Salinihabitans flavidus]SEO68607.1 hippurate hydrolase [Salinihabitans flavidus]
MPVINRIAGFADEIKTWRRHIHAHPELGRECHETARFVVERLKEFGITEISTGWAQSGVVAVIEGQGEGPTIGLRADMDALLMEETTGAEYASTMPGKMHACGHDGHTAMLLGAAKYLAETRNFRGRAVLIFQPDEEGGGGGEAMVQEGLMETFGIDEVYGIHNAPNMPEGHLLLAPGPVMAAVDSFYIDIQGAGGHGAMPHDTRDPVMAAVGIAQALQTIVSRNHDAQDRLVLSLTQITTGSATNIIPDTARMCGTVRTFDPGVQAMVMRRMQEIVDGQAASFGVTATLDYEVGYPATVNDPGKAGFAADVARDVVGTDRVDDATRPMMAAEDFSYMLNARPGAYLFLGQGESATVHHPAYDFNDAIAPVGASFLSRLVEKAAPL